MDSDYLPLKHPTALIVRRRAARDIPSDVVVAHRWFVSLLACAPWSPVSLKFSGLYKGYIYVHYDTCAIAQQVLEFYQFDPAFQQFTFSWATNIGDFSVQRGWIPWMILNLPTGLQTICAHW